MESLKMSGIADETFDTIYKCGIRFGRSKFKKCEVEHKVCEKNCCM